MAFTDEDTEEIARVNHAIGATKIIIDLLSYTASGSPSKAHELLYELEERAKWLWLRTEALRRREAVANVNAQLNADIEAERREAQQARGIQNLLKSEGPWH